MNKIKFEQVKELYTKSTSNIVAQIATILILFSYYISIQGTSLGFISCSVVMIVYLLVRYTILKKKLSQFNLLTNDYELDKFHKLFSILIVPFATFWMVFISYPFLFFKLTSFQTDFYVFVVAAIVVSGVGTLSISKRDFWFFTLPQLCSLLLFFTIKLEDKTLFMIQILVFIAFVSYLYQQQNANYRLWYNFQLEKNNQQYLLNSFPGFVSLVKNNTVVFANHLFNQIENENILTFSKILTEETQSLIDSNQKEKSYEVTLLTDKQPQEHLVMISKLPEKQFIIVGLNIQNQKNIEAQIKEQKALLDQSSKMAALGEMSGGIAHEINNPLAVISLTNQKLRFDLKQYKDCEPSFVAKTNQSIEKFDHMVSRISKIIKALREFARDGSNDSMQMAKVDSILEDTLSFCESKFVNASIKIVRQIDTTLKINCRATEISQVLLNLFNNAYDALIKTKKTQIEKTLTISTRKIHQTIQIFIQDNGDGIPEEIREKVMQPFFTTKDVGQGTGLGLSISRSIMLSHGGKIFFDYSQPQTTVVIEFPLQLEN